MPTPIMPLGRGRSLFDDFSSEDIVEVARAQDEERRQRETINQPVTNETLEDMLNATVFESEDLTGIEHPNNYFDELNRGTNRRRNNSNIERATVNLEQYAQRTFEQDSQRALETARRVVNVPDQDAYSENAPSQLIDPDSYNSLYRRQVTGARRNDVQQVITASDQQRIEEVKIEEANKLEEAKKNFDNPMAGLDV